MAGGFTDPPPSRGVACVRGSWWGGDLFSPRTAVVAGGAAPQERGGGERTHRRVLRQRRSRGGLIGGPLGLLWRRARPQVGIRATRILRLSRQRSTLGRHEKDWIPTTGEPTP